MTNLRDLPFYFVIGFAALPAAISICAVVYYNLKTFWVVRDIQAVHRQRGIEWSFWTNPARLLAFTVEPDSFLRELPSLATAEKALLINHRGRMKKYLVRTFALMFLSFGIAVALLLVMALMRK
jgi:hypothetical protein